MSRHNARIFLKKSKARVINGAAYFYAGRVCGKFIGLYLPTLILTIIWYSITRSLFHSRLKTFLFCKSFPPQPFLFLLQDSLHGFPRLLVFTVISEHICFLLLVFLFLYLLVVGSVR